MDLTDRPYTFDRVMRIIVTLLIFTGLYFFIDSVSGALLPFLIAWLIAYMLNPMVKIVAKGLHIPNKFIAIVIVLLILVSLIVGSVVAIIPSIREEFHSLILAANSYFSGRKFVDVIPSELQQYLVDNFDFKSLFANVDMSNITSVTNHIFKVIGTLFSGSFSFIMWLISFFVVLLYLVFILLDYERISNGAINLVPPKYRETVGIIAADVEKAMSRYFRGQTLVAMSVGVMLAIGFKIMGLPLGIPLGLFIGLLNMVPYLQIIGIVPLALFSLMKCVESGDNFLVVFGIAIGILIIVQIIQDTILVPRIMGKITGLNPAVILLSLSIWGSLLGVIGMIIALPMTTILLSYYQRIVIEKQQLNQD